MDNVEHIRVYFQTAQIDSLNGWKVEREHLLCGGESEDVAVLVGEEDYFVGRYRCGGCRHFEY